MPSIYIFRCHLSKSNSNFRKKIVHFVTFTMYGSYISVKTTIFISVIIVADRFKSRVSLFISILVSSLVLTILEVVFRGLI